VCRRIRIRCPTNRNRITSSTCCILFHGSVCFFLILEYILLFHTYCVTFRQLSFFVTIILSKVSNVNSLHFPQPKNVDGLLFCRTQIVSTTTYSPRCCFWGLLFKRLHVSSLTPPLSLVPTTAACKPHQTVSRITRKLLSLSSLSLLSLLLSLLSSQLSSLLSLSLTSLLSSLF